MKTLMIVETHIKLKLSCAKTVFLDKVILITSIFNLKTEMMPLMTAETHKKLKFISTVELCHVKNQSDNLKIHFKGLQVKPLMETHKKLNLSCWKTVYLYKIILITSIFNLKTWMMPIMTSETHKKLKFIMYSGILPWKNHSDNLKNSLYKT